MAQRSAPPPATPLLTPAGRLVCHRAEAGSTRSLGGCQGSSLALKQFHMRVLSSTHPCGLVPVLIVQAFGHLGEEGAFTHGRPEHVIKSRRWLHAKERVPVNWSDEADRAARFFLPRNLREHAEAAQRAAAALDLAEHSGWAKALTPAAAAAVATVGDAEAARLLDAGRPPAQAASAGGWSDTEAAGDTLHLPMIRAAGRAIGAVEHEREHEDNLVLPPRVRPLAPPRIAARVASSTPPARESGSGSIGPARRGPGWEGRHWAARRLGGVRRRGQADAYGLHATRLRAAALCRCVCLETWSRPGPVCGYGTFV